MNAKSTLRLTLTALGVLALFVYCTHRFASLDFDQDDVMNLHESWMIPLSTFLKSLTVPFTHVNRPTGVLYYRACFAFFGWNPDAFRAVTYVLMAANVLLAGVLGWLLSESVLSASLAAALYSFHGRLHQIYTSNGTVYDVVCGFFMLLALILYTLGAKGRVRRSLIWLVCVLLLSLFALNAKEMALVLPLLFVCLELLYRPVRVRRLIFPLSLGLVFLIALKLKTAAGTPLGDDPAYRLSLTADRLLGNAAKACEELFFLRQPVDRWVAPAIAAALLLLICWRRRRRALVFGAAMALLAPLPILYVPWRGFFVMYVPLIGWALVFGELLADAAEAIAAKWPRWKNAAGAFAASAAVAIVIAGTQDPQFQGIGPDPFREVIDSTVADFMRLDQPLHRKPYILLLHSRFPDDAWGPLMIARLVYHDRDLWLERPTMIHEPVTGELLARYDYIFDMVNGRLALVRVRAGSVAARANRPDTDPQYFRNF